MTPEAIKFNLKTLSDPMAECMPDGYRLTEFCKVSREALKLIVRLEKQNKDSIHAWIWD